MANDGEASFSAETPRGAGGKLRRKPARKAPATPYSRPAQNQSQRRWISRIVDPAYRILSGGATRILPYFFSRENAAPALPASDAQEQYHQDKSQIDLKDNVDDGNLTPGSNNLVPISTNVGGPRIKEKGEHACFDISAQAKGKTTSNDDGGISELERLMEGRKFSRDEVDRLLEIISSRAVDLPDAGKEKKNVGMPLDEEAKNFGVSLQMRKETISDKETKNDLWAVSTHLTKPIVPDEVGLSPVELAKAYMGGQTPTLGSKGLLSMDERDNFDGDIFSAKPSIASPSCKPSTCWPGAKSTEQYGFGTPQSQRERFGLHNLPRTPYSRTILSKSKSKFMQLQDDSSKRLNIFQSPSQHMQTPYGQLTQSKGINADRGSFGPSRRLRQNATTASRMSPYSRPPTGTPQLENSEGFFPAIKKSTEAGGPGSSLRSQSTYAKHKRSEIGTPTVPPHSSQIARTILEHLERNQPTPKDKSAELKLATSWRKSQPLDGAEKSSLNGNNVDKDGSAAALNSDKGIFLPNNLPSSIPRPISGTTSSKVENARNKTATALNGAFRGIQAANSGGSALLFGFGEPKDSNTKSKHEEDTAKAVPFPLVLEAPSLPKPASHSPGTKPVLPALSVAKPIQRWAVSSDPSSGFTFPVSSSSGASSEPPTPSILPSSPPTTASANEKKKDDDEIPEYSFGNIRSSPYLDFSVPFTSDASSVLEDDSFSDLKFTFGSENEQRVSFGSVGNDAVCC
ncbi:PREDICTED: nuclear pore complex protein NUP1 [Tarenaya hassleriana]|uniref:nuclear pore complex protein NUP1 n=1 Tax=Tarenaya hassleriana TaxID=28532 RepID=UPI00053C4211|nr:PREDICTED: nuclear pore complex protein NUP1 [Tarenaya hassleriana]